MKPCTLSVTSASFDSSYATCPTGAKRLTERPFDDLADSHADELAPCLVDHHDALRLGLLRHR